MDQIEKTLQLLQQGTVDCLPAGLLKKKLETGKKLKIKLGMDPTAPDLHLGHAVVLRKMRQFQDLGHEVIFLIGDYTAAIGDPTGKSKTRPPLSVADIEKNSKTYFEQIERILDPAKVRIEYNSTWLSKLSFSDTIQLCAKVTVARLLERDDFAKRMSNQQPIALHELLYPIMQGYDSVALDADVELGGTDQTFNLLCGRFLQEQYGKSPQVILTTPLLEGLDGVEKMSKSLGNYIGLTDQPSDAYGKLMSISDTLMWRYYSLLLSVSDQDIQTMKNNVAEQKVHPMDLKKQMAYNIIQEFWSEQQAVAAQENFIALFQKKDLSQGKPVALPSTISNPIWIIDLLKELGAIASTSDGKRLIESGAVSCDGVTVLEFKAEIAWRVGMTIKVGKHRIFTLT
ncbi:tyrosine--tRNA ligase [Candidatus Chromulinivorax destructor]|uniref:Tyrosine--tRNA ligase n=1 Tax=Candidatus Chromulinivorax destructor TaxID=2066483 RepID=A0A345ZBN8_9BACT|nr:tyrosine--tRNA ligase [Candidatus Chromulinivorax destructor]AXK60705.1 tyrosine--tRNA ligase [Candidatus Chromulinivorax destructor]